MKKLLFLIVILSSFMVRVTESQGLLNKVKNAVSKELSGKSQGTAANTAPEPSCACNDAKLIIDLQKFNIDYREVTIKMKDDGSILIRDKISGQYYIIKEGTMEGPFTAENSRVMEFDPEEESDSDDWTGRFRGFITKSGDKYIIRFNGKSYGPYAQINDFAISGTKDKFAAIVTETMMVTEDQGKKMEEAIAKAKTDQERMDIAMKFSQQMTQQISQAGGMASMQPQLVTNVPGGKYDPMTWMGGRLNGSIKFDEITVIAGNKVIDLSGKPLITLGQGGYDYENVFLNTGNTRYATYSYGTLTFSDNTKLSDLFYPALVKRDGKVSLSYLYYSPSKNAIMQCLVPF